MKFELRPPGKQYADSELLDDLKRVARLLQKSKLFQKEYRSHGGKHAVGTFAERFGSWAKALSQAGLKSAQRLPATEEELLDDLRRVSRELGKPSVTIDEYERIGKFSRVPFSRVFGTWVLAVKKAGLSHSENFNPRVSDEKLFQNLERMWIALGRQPAYLEMERPLSDHSVTTYERRFGSWRATLDAFVSYVNEPVAEALEKTSDTPTTANLEIERSEKKAPQRAVRRTPRAPNDRLRFIVHRRDNFSCRSCGRSPANEPGVILHVDHILSWTNGGETILQNLQTLCERCNLGKGKLDGSAVTA